VRRCSVEEKWGSEGCGRSMVGARK